jgi:hypothetical protein
VAPIFYTYLKTMIISFRLRRTLKNYDIEASVNSRLLSGIVDVNVPTYHLTVLPRDTLEYWSHKTTDGSGHGASWQSINWQRTPIDEKMIQVHFSEQIKLPEASIDFAVLMRYLGDLGLQTNSEGFWELSQKGLNVRPGTCLMKEIREDRLETPILVVAKPTREHPGTLLLRFQNKPSKSLRTGRDLDPDWIRVPTVPKTTVHAKSKDVTGSEAVGSLDSEASNETTDLTKNQVDGDQLEKAEEEVVEYVQISRKGILEKKLVGGITLPVVGLPFWFVYATLASTALDSHHEYNGRPFGYQIRIEYLYFSREICFPFDNAGGQTAAFEVWATSLSKLLDATKVGAIPQQWTEDSIARKNIHLTKRFEVLLDSKRRNRAAEFRRPRQKSLELVGKFHSGGTYSDYEVNLDNIYIPFEVFSIPITIWSEAAGHCSDAICPLIPDRVPTSQEICIAAMSNVDLASQVSDTLMKFYKWFEGEGESPDLQLRHCRGGNYSQVILMCAIIIIQSIADGAPYLAALGDVEKCVTTWDPVYLC